jgi:hypothetical protein
VRGRAKRATIGPVRENVTSPDALARYFEPTGKYQAMYGDYLRSGLITTLNPEDSENLFNHDCSGLRQAERERLAHK